MQQFTNRKGMGTMRNRDRNAAAQTPRTLRLACAAGSTLLGLTALLAGSAVHAQDAAAVDAKHYKVAFENDQVRILRITYGPHEKSVMHSHPAGVVVFLNDLHGRFTMPDGTTANTDVEGGTVAWTEAETHQPENLGDTPFEVIQIEMKGAGDTAAAEAMIRASAPAWAAKYNAADAKGLAAMYWEDSLLMPPGHAAVPGGAALHEYFATETKGFKEAGLTMNIPEAGAIDVAGDLAYEAGVYTVTDASGATIDEGKYIGVFQKRDGQWRYIRDTWNSDLAPPPDGE